MRSCPSTGTRARLLFIGFCLGLTAFKVHKVGTFTSEKQLTASIQSFFEDPSHTLLVLQCDSVHDAPHILLTKSIVDKTQAEYKNLSMLNIGIIISCSNFLIIFLYLQLNPNMFYSSCTSIVALLQHP
jgi:hypothetical protein